MEAYDRLDKRRELYIRATKRGNFIRRLGVIIFLLAFLYFFLIFLLAIAVPSIGRMSIFAWVGGWSVGVTLGLILIFIGDRITNRNEYLAPFSFHEAAFLKVVNSLKGIDTYQKDGIELSKMEAGKELSKFENTIKEPRWVDSHLWEELTKEETENLRLLKRNTKERLLPSITQGTEEEIKKAYVVVEKLAMYLLNPIVSELKKLNESILELSFYPPEKSWLDPFFGHPYMRHVGLIIFFVFLGFLVFYLGIHVVGVSTDNAYIAGTTLSGALIAGYMVLMVRKS